MGGRLCTLAILALTLLAAPAANAGSSYQPVGVPPPGANDFSCKPSADHPNPVILVHGTFEDMTMSWNELSPRLKASGYCVYALDYGHRGTDPIEGSAQELSDFVDRVLAATGAERVSMVGHSQGGMMPRYYLKFLGGTAKVDDLVGLSPSNHGTTTPLAPPVGQYGDCQSCSQQVAGSDFITRLNSGDETPAPVSYTVVQTRNDEVVTPYSSAFLPETSDGRVTNVLVQDSCSTDSSDHVGIQYDPVALAWVMNALARAGPADPGYRPGCSGG